VCFYFQQEKQTTIRQNSVHPSFFVLGKPTLDILISDVQHYDARKLQLVVNDEIVPSYNISINETVDSQSVINEESDQVKNLWSCNLKDSI